MAKEVIKISVREYAKSLGISHTSVSKAIKSGKLKKGVSYLIKMHAGSEIEVPEINKEIADKEWGFLHQNKEVKPGQNKLKIHSDTSGKETSNIGVKSFHNAAGNLPDQSNSSNISMEDEKLITSIPITNDLSYSEALRRREVIALILDKYKLEQVQGSVFRKDDLDKELKGLAVEMKKAFLNLPSRICPILRSIPNEVEAINALDLEIRNILNLLSSYIESKS